MRQLAPLGREHGVRRVQEALEVPQCLLVAQQPPRGEPRLPRGALLLLPPHLGGTHLREERRVDLAVGEDDDVDIVRETLEHQEENAPAMVGEVLID